MPRRLRLRRHRLVIRMPRTNRIIRSLAHPFVALPVVVLAALAVTALAAAQSAPAPVDRLVAAMLGDTPMVEDLRVLTDEIGGRATGSAANLKAVEWALERFKAAGVDARKEAFPMPARWMERSVSVIVSGDASFAPRVAAMPFSTVTPVEGLKAPLVDGGPGAADDLKRLGASVKGAWVVVETPELLTVDDLFREYMEASAVEGRFLPAGPAGIIYAASRPRDLLYRHDASRGPDNAHPMMIMEREEAQRILRLLRAGRHLTLSARIDIETGGPYESYNVIGEIRGSDRADEIVVVGAHLDSWELGTGANDDGCNAALVIDLARQMKRLGLRPRRTIRFGLFNGEEQGMYGSWGDTVSHRAELARHMMASAYDIGSGRINGFYTDGRADLLPLVENALAPVAGLGPFRQLNEPVVGTDNFDFMLEGIPNLVANQESANYGPDYHARSDTFDKVDLRQLRLNAAIAAAVTWGFADSSAILPRHALSQVDELVATTPLGEQMKAMGVWKDWNARRRGLSRERRTGAPDLPPPAREKP